MAITAISRDWGSSPAIVRISSSDSMATIEAASYITVQAANIFALNKGEFAWLVSDVVLVYASDGWGLFNIKSDFTSLQTFLGAGEISLADGKILIGNASGIAAELAMTGDGTLSNAGVFAIAADSIINADINTAAAIAFSKLAALTSANLLVGSAANVATSVSVTGDVTIGNTGVTAIAADAIINADINSAAAIDFSKLEVMTSGNILVGSAANVATEVTMSGDTTIIASGAVAIGADKVLSSMISPLVVKYAAVPISAVQFNGMYAAPHLLVAAGGADTMIVLHRCDLLMTFVSAAYQAGGVSHIQYDDTANGAGVIASTTLSAATSFANASTGFVHNLGVVPQTFSTCANKGLYLSNVTQAFTTGDSPFVAHIYYSIVPTV